MAAFPLSGVQEACLAPFPAHTRSWRTEPEEQQGAAGREIWHLLKPGQKSFESLKGREGSQPASLGLGSLSRGPLGPKPHQKQAPLVSIGSLLSGFQPWLKKAVFMTEGKGRNFCF